ncbi:hypothetical protein ACIOHE_39360 [Streptomyces sp. NPDC087851]|uniref:hypothetical protein n=1 Tax=Streptomyces sp. NPDC087851 TaxID=3365810 RepID=UPI00381BFB4E
MAEQEVRGVPMEQWTPELALSVLRENRRRYAHEGWMQAESMLGAQLAKEVAEQSGVAPADIVAVLLHTSAKLASLALVHEMPAGVLAEIMQIAADDLDQQVHTASSDGSR